MSCCDLQKQGIYIFYMIQYLKDRIYKRNLFTETLQNSDSECSTWPWVFCSLFSESIIALPYRQRVTPVLSTITRKLQFLSKRLDKNQECGSPFLKTSRILHLSITFYIKCTQLHISMRKIATAAIKYCHLDFPSTWHQSHLTSKTIPEGEVLQDIRDRWKS